jgi:hypothetical protein
MDEQRHDVALAEYIDDWRPTRVGIEKRVNFPTEINAAQA